MRAKSGTILSVLLLIHSLAATAFWTNSYKAFFQDDLSYEQRRIAYAFNQIPVDKIAAKLNSLLPITTPIALSPELARSDFHYQRLNEALYPRIIDKNAPHVLDLKESSFLSGPQVAPPSSPAITESFEFSILSFLGSFLSAVGFGLILWFYIFRKQFSDLQLLIPISIFLGTAFIGTVVSMASWFQISLNWFVFETIGLFAFTFGVIKFVRDSNLKSLSFIKIKEVLKRPELLILLIFLGVFFIRMTLYPITLWDGRSIWFFHAKRIFHHGMYFKQDILRFDTIFSNTVYPQLFTGWLAYFSGFEEFYNERMASLGIPVFHSALLLTFWYVSRQILGRWPGTAITCASFFAADHLASGGYVDQYVMIFLSLITLTLTNDRFRALSFLCIFLASMIKVEGFIYSAIIVAIFGILNSEQRFAKLHLRLLPLVALLPAAIHRAWTKAIGIPNVLEVIQPNDVLSQFLSRMAVVIDQVPRMMGLSDYVDYTHSHQIIWDGFFGLCFSIGFFFLFYRELRLEEKTLKNFSMVALSALALAIVAVLGVCSLLQFDIRWLVYVTLDRLWLHGGLIFTMAPFFLTITPRQNLPG